MTTRQNPKPVDSLRQKRTRIYKGNRERTYHDTLILTLEQNIISQPQKYSDCDARKSYLAVTLSPLIYPSEKID